MHTIAFLTGNTGKFLEIENFLKNTGIQLKRMEIELEEIQDVDAKKVIEHKTHEAIRQGYKNFFLEDTSLYLHGLGNLPGPLIKWFLLELKPIGISKLAKRIGNAEAYAETIIAFVNEQKEIRYFSGRTDGCIVAPRGEGDFGWGSIFQPKNSKKTFAQMSASEKHKSSMRIKAFQRLRSFLKKKKGA